MAQPKRWLVCFAWRKLGKSDWNYTNEVVEGSPAKALLKDIESSAKDRIESRMVMAVPITKADYSMLDGMLP